MYSTVLSDPNVDGKTLSVPGIRDRGYIQIGSVSSVFPLWFIDQISRSLITEVGRCLLPQHEAQCGHKPERKHEHNAVYNCREHGPFEFWKRLAGLQGGRVAISWFVFEISMISHSRVSYRMSPWTVSYWKTGKFVWPTTSYQTSSVRFRARNQDVLTWNNCSKRPWLTMTAFRSMSDKRWGSNSQLPALNFLFDLSIDYKTAAVYAGSFNGLDASDTFLKMDNFKKVWLSKLIISKFQSNKKRTLLKGDRSDQLERQAH